MEIVLLVVQEEEEEEEEEEEGEEGENTTGSVAWNTLEVRCQLVY